LRRLGRAGDKFGGFDDHGSGFRTERV
jgi:hypothetical protein